MQISQDYLTIATLYIYHNVQDSDGVIDISQVSYSSEAYVIKL